MAAPRKKRLLLLTNSEHGQANVFLAVSYALLQNVPPPELHVASFEYLKPLALECSQQALKNAASAGTKGILFHTLPEPSIQNAMARNTDVDMAAFRRPPGIANTTRALKNFIGLTCPWGHNEFISLFKSIVDIIQKVDPDLVVVDNLLSPAMTALRHLEKRHVVLSPNTIKDWALGFADALFKFPCSGSGLPYPLPPSYWIRNIYFTFCLVIFTLFDTRGKALADKLKSEAGCDLVLPSTIVLSKPDSVKIIVAVLPELDFDLNVPDNIATAGPMLRVAAPVAEVDPELEQWLERGPTVFINLGTHHASGEEAAVEMAKAVRILLEADARNSAPPELQVLWKLKRVGEYEVSTPQSGVHGVLGGYMDSDRVRIVDWLKPEPPSILGTGKIVCSVNHGGANSFLESVHAGVPQVVLPIWADTYDFANRAEYLGVGLWGSKKARPGWAANELGAALTEVVIGTAAEPMRVKARELASLCRSVEGRDVAARVILDLVDDEAYKGTW